MSDEEEAYVDKVSAISRLRFADPEDALREVAEQIEAGNDDPLFRKMLANMIHPDRRPVSGRKLVLKGPRHAPRKARNRALEEFLEIQRDIHEVPEKIVIDEATTRFGIGRSAAHAALASARADRDPEVFAGFRESVLDLARRGAPEYQPVWSPKK